MQAASIKNSGKSKVRNKWDQTASLARVNRVLKALKKNGINALVVGSKEEARNKVLSLIPERAEVMSMTSRTLEEIGITTEINESGKYDSVRKKLLAMDRATQGLEMKKLGAAPQWVIGSIQAVTENGEVIIASNTGSQLGAYAYSSPNVVWVVGTQKIVKNIDEGFRRIYDHVLKLESDRLKKLFGVPSNVSKLLIINREVNPQRIRMILVNQPLGF